MGTIRTCLHLSQSQPYSWVTLGKPVFLIIRPNAGIEHVLEKQNRRVRAILLMLLNSVLMLILTVYTFDHRLIMNVMRCDSMLMSQPAETWVREVSLPVFLAVTRAFMWQAGFMGVRRLVTVVQADLAARSKSKKYQAVHCPGPTEYAKLGLEVAGALALAVVLQGHEVCRWAVWTLLAATVRRMVMKSLSDPHIRAALGLPALVGTLLPLFRLCEALLVSYPHPNPTHPCFVCASCCS